MATAYENTYASLAKALLDEIVRASDPCPVRAIRILTSLRRESNISDQPITVSILENTKIGKVLAKTVKLCKKLRTAENNGKWHEVTTIAEALLVNFRAVFDTERTTAKDNNEQMAAGLHSGSERPKLKLKYASRFDSQSFDSNAEERKVTNNSRGTANGFNCPRCTTLCSYDSKVCTICSLECYYKVGVGVLGLKERDRDMSGSLKRKRSSIQDDKEVDTKIRKNENPNRTRFNGRNPEAEQQVFSGLNKRVKSSPRSVAANGHSGGYHPNVNNDNSTAFPPCSWLCSQCDHQNQPTKEKCSFCRRSKESPRKQYGCPSFKNSYAKEPKDRQEVANSARKSAESPLGPVAVIGHAGSVHTEAYSSWQCDRCKYRNAQTQTRCCSCQAWRGGNREKFKPRNSKKTKITGIVVRRGEKAVTASSNKICPRKMCAGTAAASSPTRNSPTAEVASGVMNDNSANASGSVKSKPTSKADSKSLNQSASNAKVGKTTNRKTVSTADDNINTMAGDSKMIIAAPDTDHAPNASKMANDSADSVDVITRHDEEVNRGKDQEQHFNQETLPSSLYKPHQRVYAKDDITGLLYQAMVRKVLWGPRSHKASMVVTSSLAVDGTPHCVNNFTDYEKKLDEDDEDEDQRWNPKHNGWYYYVHYMGWAVKWDRWVEERFLYEDSMPTDSLAKTLMTEYKKFKPKRKGQKMSMSQMNKWMQRMMEVEVEYRRMASVREGGDASVESKKDAAKVSEQGNAEPSEILNEHFKDNAANVGDTVVKEETIGTKIDNKTKDLINKLSKEALQKTAELRESGLQTKRKKSISDRLLLPFNLKKVLVEEWEVITQCDMVHNLPSKVTVREALACYLESKLAPLRKERKKVSNNGPDKTSSLTEDCKKVQIDDAPGSNDGKVHQSQLGKEWIDMVEGIALFFDQALPVHLLFMEERGQYLCLQRQIAAQRRNSAASKASTVAMLKTNKLNEEASVQSGTTDSSTTVIELLGVPKETKSQLNEEPANVLSGATDNATAVSESTASSGNAKPAPPNFLPERMSEIYGCEYLLRLFVRLPGIVTESPAVSDMQSRRIFSKLGDLVRYLQKHQSQLFGYSFRRPLPGEGRCGSKKVDLKRKGCSIR